MLKGRRGVRAVVPLIAVALLGIAIAAPVAAQASPDAVAAAKKKKKKKKKKPPAVKTRTATGATVSPLERITVVATCPKGTQVVGGGHSSLALNNVADTSADAHLVYESRRLTPRQWTVTAIRIDNDPEGNALDLTAMAKCRVLAKLKKKKSRPRPPPRRRRARRRRSRPR